MNNRSVFIFLNLFLLSSILVLYGIYKFNFNNVFLFCFVSFCAVFLAFNIGSNDAANSFGTSVGSKALTLKQALVVCAIFEISGVLFAGNKVVETIRDKIIIFPDSISPVLFVCIMLSALLSSGIWILLATKKGLPISATHCIIGGLVGASIMMCVIEYDKIQTFNIVKWQYIGLITLSWAIVPFLSCILAYFLYAFVVKNIIVPIKRKERLLRILKEKKRIIQSKYISDAAQRVDAYLNLELDSINKNDDFQIFIDKIKARKKVININKNLKFIPYFVCSGLVVNLGIFLLEGVKYENFYHFLTNLWILIVVVSIFYFILTSYLSIFSKTKITKVVKKIFIIFQIIGACCFAFAHGSNDIANVLAPFLAILDVLKDGDIDTGFNPSFFLFVILGIALISGFFFLGREVINTVGNKIISINPVSGFCIEVSAGAIILLFSQAGVPISSTHVLIGAILGVGLQVKRINWNLLKVIIMTWLITLPTVSLLSTFIFLILRMILMETF